MHARTNLIFECSTRYTSKHSNRVRYRVEHEKIKFVSTSGHVKFCLLYKRTNDYLFHDFPMIFQHVPKILQKLSEGQTIIPEHFPKI